MGLKLLKRNIQANRNGKITSGERGKLKSLPYFNITEFPELVKYYGNEPEKLLVYLPSNKIEDFLMAEKNKWGKKGESAVKTMVCDEQTHVDCKTGEVSPCPGEDTCDAKFFMQMKAYVAVFKDKESMIPEIVSNLCYRFQTHSRHTGNNLFSTLMDVYDLTDGRLVGVPFVLRVYMHESLDGGQKRKFPLWSMQSLASTGHILELAERATVPVEGLASGLSIDLEGENPSATLELPLTTVTEVEHEEVVGFEEPVDQFAWMKENLGKAAKLKEGLGEERYYAVLKDLGWDHANEIKNKTDSEDFLSKLEMYGKYVKMLQTYSKKIPTDDYTSIPDQLGMTMWDDIDWSQSVDDLKTQFNGIRTALKTMAANTGVVN